MKFAVLVALIVIALVNYCIADNYAVLVSGSNEFYNYRHQSDVAHTYRILKANGFDDDHIIVMAYGDVAKASQNPFPGKLFNKPTPAGVPGVDNWTGIQVDYTGKEVTAQNFIKVLTGNTTDAKGPVLQTTSDDNILIYYSDHGSVGSVAMPFGPVLTVNQLQNAFSTMIAKKTFNKMVFYLEACESGSMMEGVLPTDKNILVLTAANSHESSYAFYCGKDAVVEGKNIGSCLGDEFSIRFMEFAESNIMSSLKDHYTYIRDNTVGSHVQIFGDQSFINEPISNFMAQKNFAVPRSFGLSATQPKNLAPHNTEAIDSRDVKIQYLYDIYMKSEQTVEQRYENGLALMKELQSRLNADLMFNQLAVSVLGLEKGLAAHTAELPLKAYQCGSCCDAAYAALAEYPECNFTDYSLKYGRTIHAVCTVTGKDVTDLVVSKIKKMCSRTNKFV